ncbi:MAG TPA: hypothetical protein VH326_06485 [Sphingomonas sp.]|nr:hypothetical protein [Sphingomonas sp.]
MRGDVDSGGPNVQDVGDNPYKTVGDTDFYLVEVPPGEYVFYGMGAIHNVITCNCLGTVGFTTTPGHVTDIGTVVMDVVSRKSDVPELAGETGLGASANGSRFMTVATIRPAGAQTPGMPELDSTIVAPADFEAIGPYPNALAVYINRLAPIVGILAYDKDGHVLDVKRGVEAPPR